MMVEDFETKSSFALELKVELLDLLVSLNCETDVTLEYIKGSKRLGTEIFTVLEEVTSDIKEKLFDEKVIETPNTEAMILKQQQYPRLHLGAKTTRDELFSNSELRETWFNSN